MPTKVLVVGASNSSMDLTLECWGKGGSNDGSEKRQNRRAGEYWVKPNIENRIAEVSKLFQLRIASIDENYKKIERPLKSI